MMLTGQVEPFPLIWLERMGDGAALSVTGAHSEALDGRATFATPAQAEQVALVLVALLGWPLAEVGTA